MTGTYEYHGYTFEIAVESDFGWRLVGGNAERVGYVAIVRIFQAEHAVAVFSPLRFGEAGGRSVTVLHGELSMTSLVTRASSLRPLASDLL